MPNLAEDTQLQRFEMRTGWKVHDKSHNTSKSIEFRYVELKSNELSL
jgi:hypothetical protein